jgi:hypothetical protein
MSKPRRATKRLAWALPFALGSLLALARCDSDGVTPVCPADGGDCVTPPGTSTASVVPSNGGAGSATTGDAASDAP